MSSNIYSGSVAPGGTSTASEFIGGNETGNTTRLFMRTIPGRKGSSSFQMNILAVSSSANTFTVSTGTPATLTIQGITLTAVANATRTNAAFQNSITFQIQTNLGSGLNFNLTEEYGIQVFCDSSTSITTIVTAYNAISYLTDVASMSGASATFATDMTDPVPLSGATNAGFNTTTGIITIATVNGTQFPGQKGQLTISAGSLPTGFALVTSYATYFANSTYTGTGYGSPTQFQLFTTVRLLAEARQRYNNGWAPVGTSGLIIPTTLGTAGSTVTFTPISFTGSTLISANVNDTLIGPNPVTGSNPRNISQNNIVTPSNATIALPVGIIWGGANATLSGVGSFFDSFAASPYYTYAVLIPNITASYIAQIIGKG